MIERIDPKAVPGRVTTYNNMIEADIREFMESGWDVAEVKTEKYKTVTSSANAYRTAVKRMCADCIVTARSGRLFLMRK